MSCSMHAERRREYARRYYYRRKRRLQEAAAAERKARLARPIRPKLNPGDPYPRDVCPRGCCFVDRSCSLCRGCPWCGAHVHELAWCSRQCAADDPINFAKSRA